MEDTKTTLNENGESNTINLNKQQEKEDITTQIKHYACEVSNELMAKIDAICDLLLQFKSQNSIIYCSSRGETEVVEKIIRRKGINARRITSDLSQSQVDKVLEKISTGQLPVLVAVDFLKQSLNNEKTDLIINHALPETAEYYLKFLNQLNTNTSIINIIGVKDFGNFYTLKKSLSQIEFKDIELGLPANVSMAKLNTFNSVLQNIQTEIKNSDLEVARSFLSENGISDAKPKFVEVIARVCSALTEHAFPDKVISLEEELADGDGTNADKLAQTDAGGYDGRDNSFAGENQGGGRGRYGRDFDRRPPRDGDRDNRDRGGRRDFSRDRDDRDNRGRGRNYGGGRYGDSARENTRDNRGSSRSDDFGGHRGGGYNKDSNFHDRGDRRRHFDDDSKRGDWYEGGRNRRYNSFEDNNNEDKVFNSRLYIGQGTNSGLTESEFKQLATSVGDIDANKIIRLKLRENYGFIDVEEDVAGTLVNNLNGIEYNGAILPVQHAGKVKE